jgi:iron-sulfur cluster assembly protein
MKIETPIKLTESALVQLKKIKEDKNITEEHGLRVGVKGGGCSGFSYILGFDLPKDNDQIFEIGGVKVFFGKGPRPLFGRNGD